MSFWSRARPVAKVLPSNAHSAKPITLFASSMAPIASMRAACLAILEPSTRPVEPSSPVFV